MYGRTVYAVWIGRSYCETRPGFPHSARPRFVVPGEALKPPGLRWHCPRPPGDSAQACSFSSTPAAISQPPPSSRPSAFSAARLPSPRYGFARSAPLRSAPLRVARLRRSEFFFPHSASSSPSHFSPGFPSSVSFFRASACPMRRRDSAIATRPASTDKFHASYTTSSSPVPSPPGVEWHATSGSRSVSCQPSRETLNIAFHSCVSDRAPERPPTCHDHPRSLIIVKELRCSVIAPITLISILHFLSLSLLSEFSVYFEQFQILQPPYFARPVTRRFRPRRRSLV